MKKREKEILAMIKGYEFMYWVSNHGRIKNKHGLFMKIGKNKGYNVVDLYSYGRRKTMRVNRLVAIAFLRNDDDKPYVNHRDGNKANDYYKNLEWSTQKENLDHAVESGLVKRGEDSPYAILTNNDVLDIFSRGESHEIIAGIYGISRGHVTDIRSGRKWGHLTGKKHTPKGRMSPEAVLSIYASCLTYKEIAMEHHVTTGVVSHIKTGILWSGLTGHIHIRKRKT